MSAPHEVLPPDANLRAPHDDETITVQGLKWADFVKLNEHEVVTVAQWLQTPPNAGALWSVLQSQFSVKSFCVTEGEKGARLWHEGTLVEQAAFPTIVADTIGAGDSFLAMLLGELLRGAPPKDAMRRAARLAAFVASQPGASPDYDPATFRNG